MIQASDLPQANSEVLPVPLADDDSIVEPWDGALSTERPHTDISGPPPSVLRAAEEDDEDDDPSAYPSVSVDVSHPDFESVEDPRIPPGRRHFKIGAVARIVGVKPYVLRYWESAFPWIQPDKTDSGQRRYRREDVAVLLQVRRLRHDEKLTVARTKKLLEESRRTGRPLHLPGAASELAAPVHAESLDKLEIQRRIDGMREQIRGLLEMVED